LGVVGTFELEKVDTGVIEVQEMVSEP